MSPRWWIKWHRHFRSTKLNKCDSVYQFQLLGYNKSSNARRKCQFETCRQQKEFFWYRCAQKNNKLSRLMVLQFFKTKRDSLSFIFLWRAEEFFLIRFLWCHSAGKISSKVKLGVRLLKNRWCSLAERYFVWERIRKPLLCCCPIPYIWIWQFVEKLPGAFKIAAASSC